MTRNLDATVVFAVQLPAETLLAFVAFAARFLRRVLPATATAEWFPIAAVAVWWDS